ncbi:hypothetical protein Q8814_22670 [Rhodococcus sp. CC-R104]|uniref:Uncharacterized protein n=1 Tax=Rhodococcus chondri TaxID=3065941 RepID=A0ABU7JXY5_9NOCA|nr:hypothetical protein [Rhodococcus sp. CC-R104]
MVDDKIVAEVARLPVRIVEISRHVTNPAPELTDPLDAAPNGGAHRVGMGVAFEAVQQELIIANPFGEPLHLRVRGSELHGRQRTSASGTNTCNKFNR